MTTTAAAPTDSPGGGGSASRPLLLCLSHLRWDFVTQRPQHLLTRAARAGGHRVVFWEEPLPAEPGAAPRLDRRAPTPEGVEVVVPMLPLGLSAEDAEAAQRRLLDGFLAEVPAPRVAWFYTPMAMGFAAGVEADVVVYDCMDELSAFRGAPPRLLDRERDLIARADLVFTGGRSLYEAKRDRHPAVHCFPSSIEAAHFARARANPPEPPDLAAIPRPRIGFFGVVDERMDLDLLAAVAALRPDWHLVMVGPVVKIDPAALPRPANIHWMGGRAYADLPDWLGHWDAGFMAFALNESTRFISPTKTPEYLAAGVPVVSTPIRDVVSPYGDEGLVGIASDAPAVVAALEEAMVRPRGPWLARADARIAQGSWDRTWADMARLIDDAARARTAGGGGQTRSTQQEATAHV